MRATEEAVEGGRELRQLASFSDARETVVPPPVEALLTWPLSSVDPWRRLSSLEHDCILVVEFSEMEGPKPALVIPVSPGVHFDPNDFALWLMTADYQLTSSSPFSPTKDIQMMLHNEEQGIHTYAHHFTLFDIEARGFLRPFCAAYLTREARTIPEIFIQLRSEITTLLESVKACNRRQFIKELSQAMDTLSSVETQTISSYYELYYDTRTLGGNGRTEDPTRTERINMQTRRLSRELDIVYRTLATESRTNPCSGSHPVDIDRWLGRTINFGHGDDDQKQLKPLSALCPCVYDDLCRGLRQNVWCKFRRHNPASRLLCEETIWNGGCVSLDGFPLLFVPRQRNTGDCQSRRKEEGAPRAQAEGSLLDTTEEERQNGDEASSRVLVSLLPSLPHVLFPLLTGQFMLLCGGDLRQNIVTQLVHKLRRFLPTAEDSSSPLSRKWHKGRVPATAFADFKLFGLHLPKSQELDQLVASNVLPFLSVLDLNSDVFHSSRFRGRVLERLSNKSSALLPSDRVLLPYIYSLVADYACIAYVLFYLVFSNHEVYRKNSRYLSKFASHLSLEPGDLKIVRYLVEILKQQQSDTPRLESAFENMFLDHEPASVFKF